MVDKVLREDEICKPYNFCGKLLPTNHDCLRFVLSRTNMKVRDTSHKEAVLLMAKSLHEIWTSADCCPYTRKHIANIFHKQVWETYKYLLREKS